MKEMEGRCWVNESEQILSFHAVEGYASKEFASHDDMLQFVFDIVQNGHYRVQ